MRRRAAASPLQHHTLVLASGERQEWDFDWEKPVRQRYVQLEGAWLVVTSHVPREDSTARWEAVYPAHAVSLYEVGYAPRQA